MGKRIAPETQNVGTKKKLRNGKIAKALNFGTEVADGAGVDYICKSVPFNSLSSIYVDKTPKSTVNQSNKQANNSSIILKRTSSCAPSSLDVFNHTESPKPVYTLRPSLVNGTILKDLKKKLWRLGPPIGKGNFGEIFLASDDIGSPVTNENAKFVVKIEPHSNGPLFVEIHCLINTAKSSRSTNSTLTGIPTYIASGSHYFGDARYRFLVLPRFDCDLHSLIRHCRIQDSSVLTLGLHILDTLEALHSHGYCHNDIKAQNLMITKHKYHEQQNWEKHVKSDYEEKQHTTDSGNSSEQEIEEHVAYQNGGGNKKSLRKRKNVNYVSAEDECYITKEYYMDDDEVITTTTTNSNDSNSYDAYTTPLTTVPRERRKKRANPIQYQGSNPVRSCRKTKEKNNNNNNSTIYEEMVKSHYLRPRERVSYSEFFNDEYITTTSDGKENPEAAADYYFKSDISTVEISSDDDDSDEFQPSNTLLRQWGLLKSSKKAPDSDCQIVNRSQSKSTKERKRKSTKSNFAMFSKSMDDEIYLIDFGLASKFMDNGIHRPFLMDQRRAHDGTLEFTSRDAHLGAHSRRSDMECLGYNLLFWSQGYLPWREEAKQQQPEQVHRAKECLMTDVRTILKKIYREEVPSFIGEYLQMVGELGYQERPDYERYRKLFKKAFRKLHKNRNEVDPLKLTRENILRHCIPIKFEPANKILIETSTPLTVNGCHHQVDSLIQSNKQLNGRLSITSRVSPKNLRSKGKKSVSKETSIINILPATLKRLSWLEILSQNPDEIAQNRAEKEFEREEKLAAKTALAKPKVRQYKGKPTYAILEMLQKRGAELPAIKLELRVKREHNDSSSNTWRLATNHRNQY